VIGFSENKIYKMINILELVKKFQSTVLGGMEEGFCRYGKLVSKYILHLKAYVNMQYESLFINALLACLIQ